MQDFLLLFITILLLVLVIELTVVLYFVIIFMQDAIIIVKRVKAFEGSMEEKIAMFESELMLMSGKIIKGIVKGANKFLKK